MELLAQYGLWGLFLGSFLAATVVPFSADVLFVGMLLAGLHSPAEVLVVATLGNWLGSLTSYGIGRSGKWEWIEKLHISRQSLEKQKSKISRFGAYIALLTWVPFVGDIFAVALGFYRIPFLASAGWTLVGKAVRFLLWWYILI